MKRILITFLALASVLGGAFAAQGDYAVRRSQERVPVAQAKASKKVDVLKSIPHLAVNEEWVSTVTIRSDALSEISLTLEFYDINGNAVPATFFDSFDDQYVDEIGFVIPDLQPGEIYSLDFDSLLGARNMQILVFSDETETNYGLEAVYNRFGANGQKTAFVGVPVLNPGQFFVVNMDQRLDPYTGFQRYRGLAVFNTSEFNCNCQATLFDDLGYPLDQFGQRAGQPGDLVPILEVDIPGSAKWLGTTYDLVENIDSLLPLGLGYFFFDCTENVSALGLSFEVGTPVTTSVPIDYFFFNNKAKAEGRPTHINQLTKRQK